MVWLQLNWSEVNSLICNGVTWVTKRYNYYIFNSMIKRLLDSIQYLTLFVQKICCWLQAITVAYKKLNRDAKVESYRLWIAACTIVSAIVTFACFTFYTLVMATSFIVHALIFYGFVAIGLVAVGLGIAGALFFDKDGSHGGAGESAQVEKNDAALGYATYESSTTYHSTTKYE